WLPESGLSEYGLAADVALLPYTDGASGGGGSLLACADHGLPIVSTQPTAAEVADAVLAVGAEAAELARTAHAASADPSLARRLRAAGRALAARCAWPRIAETQVGIYQSLLYS